MLGCQTVIYIEGDQLSVESMNDAFAEVMIKGEAAKHPPASVEIDVSCPLLGLALVVELRSWLKDTDRYLAPVDWALLFCDAVDIRRRRAPIGDSVSGRVLSELFDCHLVGV